LLCILIIGDLPTGIMSAVTYLSRFEVWAYWS
jgi:hypothetical protein